MNKKRTRLEVIKDILEVIKSRNGKIKPTHILYKSNLSYAMMEGYLAELKEKGFIVELEAEGHRKGKNGNSKSYKITDKGIEYLNKYSLVANFTESFGLD
jgi:predicted transcriptional regulator